MNEQGIRRANLLTLYVEFKAEQSAEHPTDSGRGTDVLFAEKLQIAKASLSSMKSGGRPIGPKLARQFESNFGKPNGWMDRDNGPVVELEDSKELSAFLKLAKRAFERADKSEKKELTDFVQSSLKLSGKKE